MPDKPHNPNINLIKERQISIVDKFLDWALTAGRFIVIATEIVALLAFVYRFSLDRNLIDLHAKIKQEQAIVTNLSAREKVYRSLQDRLAIAKGTGDLGAKRIKTFEDIISFAPSGIVFNSLIVGSDSIKMDLRVQNVSSLTTFVGSLKKYPNVKAVSIDRIENKPSGGLISVAITTQLKPEVNKYGASK